MKKKKIYKDADNGKFTTKEQIKENPEGTYTQVVNIKNPKPLQAEAADEVPASHTEVINEIESPDSE